MAAAAAPPRRRSIVGHAAAHLPLRLVNTLFFCAAARASAALSLATARREASTEAARFPRYGDAAARRALHTVARVAVLVIGFSRVFLKSKTYVRELEPWLAIDSAATRKPVSENMRNGVI